MQIVDTRPPQAKQENRIFRAIGCTAVYLASAGALCSMAGLGRTLLGAWGAGTVLLLALCFLPKQAKIQSIVRLSAAWCCGVGFVGVRARRRLPFPEPAVRRK